MHSRRQFIESLMLLTSGMMLPWNGNSSTLQDGNRDRLGPLLPLRKLGTTDREVTMLGTGGYHIGWTTERDAQAVIERALEQGIRFFDSAYSYGNDGLSERRYGTYLTPNYRDLVFIMSKSTATDYTAARRELEESLRRYKVDQLDLWQIHALSSPEDVDGRIQNGVLRLAEEALKEGKVKYIGFTGHASPYAHLRMIEQAGKSGLFSTLQMPINLVDAASEHSFVRLVIPKAIDAGLGLLAMKTLADGRFFPKKVMESRTVWTSDNPVVPGQVSVEDAIHFAWSMPISVLITGAENVDFLQEKIDLAKSFMTMEEKDRTDLIDKLAPFAEEGKVEYYKSV